MPKDFERDLLKVKKGMMHTTRQKKRKKKQRCNK